MAYGTSDEIKGLYDENQKLKAELEQLRGLMQIENVHKLEAVVDVVRKRHYNVADVGKKPFCCCGVSGCIVLQVLAALDKGE